MSQARQNFVERQLDLDIGAGWRVALAESVPDSPLVLVTFRNRDGKLARARLDLAKRAFIDPAPPMAGNEASVLAGQIIEGRQRDEVEELIHSRPFPITEPGNEYTMRLWESVKGKLKREE